MLRHQSQNAVQKAAIATHSLSNSPAKLNAKQAVASQIYVYIYTFIITHGFLSIEGQHKQQKKLDKRGGLFLTDRRFESTCWRHLYQTLSSPKTPVA